MPASQQVPSLEPRPATVLVVDDNVALAQVFARVLNLMGCEVLVAHNADIALQIARHHRPDSIILDFRMPFVNGVGLLYRLRAIEAMQHTPVLVITGESLNEETRTAFIELDAYVRTKPISIEALVQETRTMIERNYHNRTFNPAIAGLAGRRS